MEKQPVLFIINPLSGTGKKSDLPSAIFKYLDQDRFVPRIVYTEYSGHARLLAEKAINKGIKIIVATGGDGTMNEVASAVKDSKVCMGIIPLGSGNGLARHLGIPLNIKDAIKLINFARVLPMDYGMVNDRPFFCTAGFGFDARVGHIFASRPKRGFVTYAQTVLHEYSKYKPKKYRLKIDGAKMKKRAFLLTVANAAQFGNNAYVSPNAKIDDGFLDVTVLLPFPRPAALNLVIRFFKKTLDKSSFTDVYQAKNIQIKRKKKILSHLDGEPVKFPKKIKIHVVKNGLHVLVPYQTKSKG